MSLFAGLVREDVVSLSIFYRSGTNTSLIELELISNRFVLIKPAAVEADDEAVRVVLNDLQGLVSESFITNIDKEKLHEYGLDNPVLVLKVKLSDSSLRELDVGSGTTVGSMSYASIDSSPGTVYLVYNYKLKNLERPGSDFRGRDIFTVPFQDIVSIEIIKRGSKPWLSGNGGLKILKDKLLSLYALRAGSFYDGPVNSKVLGRYALLRPLFNIKIAGAFHTSDNLMIGDKLSGGSWPGYIPGKNELIFIDAPDLEKILDFSNEK